MGVPSTFYKGVRLWEVCRPWEPRSVRVSTAHFGATQEYAYSEPGSPNASRTLNVMTSIDPIEPSGELDGQAAVSIVLADVEDELWGLSKERGPIAYAKDVAEVGLVTSGPHASSGVAITCSSIGWTPVAGHYVLLRDPSTGNGFLGTVSSATSSTITVAEAIADTWQTVSSGWEIVFVQLAYAEAVFDGMSWGGPPAMTREGVRVESVSYAFSIYSAPLFYSGHAVARGN